MLNFDGKVGSMVLLTFHIVLVALISIVFTGGALFWGTIFNPFSIEIEYFLDWVPDGTFTRNEVEDKVGI